jgi:hypothetical protein
MEKEETLCSKMSKEIVELSDKDVRIDAMYHASLLQCLIGGCGAHDAEHVELIEYLLAVDIPVQYVHYFHILSDHI